MSQVFKYSGVVEDIGQIVKFDSGFTKRRLIVGNDIDCPSKYPNPVMFSFKKDNCSLLDGVTKGDRVVVTFVVDGRRWDGPKGATYFIDLTGLKVEAVGGVVKKEAAPDKVPANETVVVGQDGIADDIPF